MERLYRILIVTVYSSLVSTILFLTECTDIGFGYVFASSLPFALLLDREYRLIAGLSVETLLLMIMVAQNCKMPVLSVSLDAQSLFLSCLAFAVVLIASERYWIISATLAVYFAISTWGGVPLPLVSTSVYALVVILLFWGLKESWFRYNIRLFPLIHFAMLTWAGWMLSGRNLPANLVWSVNAVLCAWHYTTAVNDIYDIETDRINNPGRSLVTGMAQPIQFHEISIINGILSLVFAIQVSLWEVLGVVVFIILGFAYSTPPLRFKKYPVGSLFIALGSIIAFLCGFFSNLKLPDASMYRLIAVMFIAFVSGITVKDLKDIEGDRKAGVRTIFTVFGLSTGLKICTVLLLIAFFSPVLLFSKPSDLAIYSTLYLSCIVVLWRFKRPFSTFPFFAMEFIYCVFRYTGHL